MSFLPKNIEQALLREQERKQRMKLLTQAAEEMRKRGASKKIMWTAIEGLNEYMKITKKPVKPDNSEPTPTPNEDAPGTLLSDVETQVVKWLWQGRIPLGKITILDGDPGMGKSLLATNIAACVSTGQPMPDGTPGRQGGIILIAPEDGAGDTLKPRVEAAGGDPSKVLLLNTVEALDVKKVTIYDRPFSLSHDLEILEDAIKRIQAALVILDPLMAVLGDLDSSRDQAVREVFTPLAQLAERTACAVLIIRHLTKGSTDKVLYRGAGSIGIIAAARIGLIVAQDPDNEHKRILATTKNNLSKQASNLTYQVAENDRGVPYLQWLGENQHSIKALFAGTNLSGQQQDILRVLKDSIAPLGPKDIAERTGHDYTAVRKTLRRMDEAKMITSAARGLYTTLNHPCLTKNVTENSDVTMEQSSQLSQLSQTFG